MKTVKIEITGISPLLMRRYDETPDMGKKSKEEQARHSAYICDKTGDLYVPGENMQRALVSAAAYEKKGRGSLSKDAAAGIAVLESRLSLGTSNYEIDSRSVVIAATKGRIMRHRPRLDQWKLSFTLEYDESLFSFKQIESIVSNCGKRVGILDFRPERKGMFGKFVHTVIHETNGQD